MYLVLILLLLAQSILFNVQGMDRVLPPICAIVRQTMYVQVLNACYDSAMELTTMNRMYVVETEHVSRTEHANVRMVSLVKPVPRWLNQNAGIYQVKIRLYVEEEENARAPITAFVTRVSEVISAREIVQNAT